MHYNIFGSIELNWSKTKWNIQLSNVGLDNVVFILRFAFLSHINQYWLYNVHFLSDKTE